MAARGRRDYRSAVCAGVICEIGYTQLEREKSGG
jgi:hypothetical protein